MLHVLLSSDPDAPTAEEIVEGYDFASGTPPPLSGLAAESPEGIEYLIPSRAVGAFKAYLDTHPDSPRARLERYIVVSYPQAANLVSAQNAFEADPNVEYVHVPLPTESSVPPVGSGTQAIRAQERLKAFGAWRQSIELDAAWQRAGGWALVGTVDSGIATSHGDLAAFTNGTYAGGNFLPALSFDVGRAGITGCEQAGNCIEPNVDEAQTVIVATGGNCDSDGDGLATPMFGGHGTHVAGLVAANTGNAGETIGTCRHCGLMAWRVTRDSCFFDGLLHPVLRAESIDAAITLQADLGAQVIN